MELVLMGAVMGWVLYWAAVAMVKMAGIDVSFVSSPSVLSAAALLTITVVARWLWRVSHYKPGDHVIYNKPKTSLEPGPRAEHVRPQMTRDGYAYTVRKLWTVADVRNDGRIEVVTRSGKRHELSATDMHLHRPHLWELLYLRLRWGKQFPALEKAA